MADLAHDGLRKKAESLEAQLSDTQATLAVYQQRTADLEKERCTYLASHAELLKRSTPVAPVLLNSKHVLMLCLIILVQLVVLSAVVVALALK